jgi:hypothetical protein
MNLALNADALMIILDSLRWAGHDTRLPQEVRDLCNDLAEKLGEIPMQIQKEEDDVTPQLG